MALTDINGLVQALAQTQQVIPFYKAGVTAFAAGSFHSLWQTAGEPGAGSLPSVAGTPTSADTGAMPLINASIGALYAGRASLFATTPGYYLLYDRIAHCNGLVGNSASSQAVTLYSSITDRTPSPDYGLGCRMFVEWYTTTGTGTPTLTVTYTNSSGVGSRTATAVWPASPVAGQMLRVPLMAGDYGIRSIQSAQLSGATSAAGDWGLTVVKPLVDFSIGAANGSIINDAIACGLPPVANNALLAWLFMATGTTHGAISGQITLVDA